MTLATATGEIADPTQIGFAGRYSDTGLRRQTIDEQANIMNDRCDGTQRVSPVWQIAEEGDWILTTARYGGSEAPGPLFESVLWGANLSSPFSPKERLIRQHPLRVRLRRNARALVTSQVQPLIDSLVAITLSKARQNHILIKSMSVSAFREPDEHWSEAVFEVNVDALPAQALAFWDCLGAELNKWRTWLPDRLADILTERLAVHVTWS